MAIEDAEVRRKMCGEGCARTVFVDDYDDRRREVHETPEQKLKGAIIKLGEVVSAPSNNFTFELLTPIPLRTRLRSFLASRNKYETMCQSTSPTSQRRFV